MSNWFWGGGHLSWLVFGILTYTLLGLLVTDFVWRVVTMRVVVLLPLAFGLWCAGVLILLSFVFG